ncbi:MAG: winged helix-turn-helix domain-containing protein [Bryobacteraceae bacterium]|jgi:TolB-like protein
MAESSLKPVPVRAAGIESERYRAGDLTVDASAGAVKRVDETLTLSPLTFDLLVALLRRAPRTVRRDELLSAVWPNEFVNDDTLSQRVRLLREALGDVSEEPRYVVSVRGWGYRLVPKVERLADEAAPIRALAVLPLANLTGDPQQEYFADGMTETLISRLARIRSLKVISRTSVMHYKQAVRRLPVIGRELGVDAIVEGSVLAAGGRVRVSVQLIRAATDEHLWAESYDRELEDVFALHADLARSIAHTIGAIVTAEEQQRFERDRRVDPVAHESEMRARYFLGKFTAPDVDRAIAHFEQAIARDPSFAEAQAGLAQACCQRALPLGGDLSVADQRGLLSRAKAAAREALQTDDTLAEAHGVIGLILLFHDWDWQGAEKALRTALEFDPNLWLVHELCFVLASTTLDRPRVLEEIRRAMELDPLNLLLRTQAAECCFWIRDYPQAVECATQALDLDPSFPRAHFVLGRIHEAHGRIAEAISEYQRAGLITTGVKAARHALQQGGAVGYHRWALRAGLTSGPRAAGMLPDRPFFRARGYARLGEIDEAIRCLEQAYEQRECLVVLLKAQEWWDPLRADQRFTDLVRRVGIP